MVHQACNPSTWKAEQENCYKPQAILSYVVRFCVKTKLTKAQQTKQNPL